MMELQADGMEPQVVEAASKVASAPELIAVEVESVVLAARQQVPEALSERPKKLHKTDKTAPPVPLLSCRKDIRFQQVQHPVPL